MCGNGNPVFLPSAFGLKVLCRTRSSPVENMAGTKTSDQAADGTLTVMMGQPDFYRGKRSALPSQVDHYLLNDHEITSFFMGTIHTVVF